MKNLIFILILLPIISAQAASVKTLDIVFDMDDTLIRWIRPDEKVPAVVIPEAGEIDNYRYRTLDGASEMIQYYANLGAVLGKDYNVRVSFYSLGPYDRNAAVLKAWKLPSGKSAFDVAYKVLSDQNGVTLGGVMLKDLTAINSDISNVVLIDDRFVTTIPGQEMNVVHILPKVEHFYSSVDEKWLDPQNVTESTTAEAYFENRNKLAYAAGIIDRAISDTRDQTLVHALTQVQYSKDSKMAPEYRKTLVTELRYYRKGAEDFRHVSSSFLLSGKAELRNRHDLVLLTE